MVSDNLVGRWYHFVTSVARSTGTKDYFSWVAYTSNGRIQIISFKCYSTKNKIKTAHTKHLLELGMFMDSEP